MYKILRLMLCLLPLSAINVGCGEDPDPSALVMPLPQPLTGGDVYEWWEVFCVAGSPYISEKSVANNITRIDDRVIFSHTGAFRHEVEFYDSEIYASDPETVMHVSVSYTTHGRYTTRRNILTMTPSNTQEMNVYVFLEPAPEAAWLQQREGMNLEEFKSAKAAEIKKELPPETPPLFKYGTEYTWQIENDDLLILSSPQQAIVLFHYSSFVDELQID